MIALDEVRLRQMVYGGAVLGAGGGGSIASGLRSGLRALEAGTPRLASLSEIPVRSRLVTLTMMGTVGGGQRSVERVSDRHHLKALDLLLKSGARNIRGLISSEVGPRAVTYGLLASARTGIPVVDAPCNGRAHPLGVMGSLGLHRLPRHTTTATAVGGPVELPVELVVKAGAAEADNIIRDAVDKANVALAVARNPLPASYVRKHAAVGALDYARQLGEALLRELSAGLGAILPAISKITRGKTLVRGLVKSVRIADRKGFSIGHVAIRSITGREIVIPVCNEFMMVLDGDRTLAAFPDLIAIFDEETGLPLSTAGVREARPVAVFGVARSRLILASTMHDRSLLRRIEKLIGMS